MGFLWGFYGVSLGTLSGFGGIPIDFLWYFYEITIRFEKKMSMGVKRISIGFSMVFPWGSLRISVGFS